ncbi:hypothetical protein SHIRM173S_01016 [Streptomyces hirsutus]
MAEMKPNVAVLPSQGLRRAATPSGVTHVREYQSDRYSIVGNHLAQHRALSLTAIGLAVYILSLPEGSPTDIRTLAERFPEGRDRIAFALRELEVCGYLARVWERTADGRMITRTYAYNAPVLTRERVHSVATSSAGSAVTAQVPATPASAVPPTALVLVDGPTEPVPAVDEEPRPAEPEAAEPDPSLSEHYGKAVDLLAGLRRTDRRLMLSLRDVRRLAPYVIAWFDNGVGKSRRDPRPDRRPARPREAPGRLPRPSIARTASPAPAVPDGARQGDGPGQRRAVRAPPHGGLRGRMQPGLPRAMARGMVPRLPGRRTRGRAGPACAARPGLMPSGPGRGSLLLRATRK